MELELVFSAGCFLFISGLFRKKNFISKRNTVCVSLQETLQIAWSVSIQGCNFYCSVTQEFLSGVIRKVTIFRMGDFFMLL